MGKGARNGMNCDRTRASGANGYCFDCVVHTRAFCAALDSAALAKLETLQSVVELQSEETLFMEGDRAVSFFTVLTGALRISKLLPDGQRQITDFVLPGEFVGLSAEETYVDHAEALTDASVCRFAMSDLRRIGADYPEMGGQLLAMTNTILTRAREHMLLLGRMKAPEKLASFLVGLLNRAEATEQPTDPLALPMSRADIADYLGLTIETVSRTFTQLRSDAIIALPEHNLVRVVDGEALAQLAEG